VVLGLGLELVEVPRFERVARRYGVRLSRRLFTDGERAYADHRKRGLESLAVRFAAKVAARRALQAGEGADPAEIGGFFWREVEVVRERGRAPTLCFHGRAAQRAAALGVERVALTLTHDRVACLAQVVLEGRF